MATFNIEDYLNSLPDDIEEINISNKNLTYIPSLERFRKLKELYCSYNELTILPNLPNTLEIIYCYNNLLPFEDIKSWNQFNKFKETYYRLKYGRRLERYYIKNIRNKNINEEMIEIVYSPDFNFYKRLLNQDIIKMFK
jgi:Leucine-rich repeat (LRR) protein